MSTPPATIPCLDDLAHGAPIPARHGGCPRCAPLSAADVELARQIALRKGYVAQPFPASRALSLRSWHRQRFMVLQELSALEKTAIESHGTTAALLAAAGLPA